MLLEDLARRLADALPDKIEGAGLQQTATAMAICVDKARLLSEKATQIVDYRELEAEIERELARIAGLKSEEVAELLKTDADSSHGVPSLTAMVN